MERNRRRVRSRKRKKNPVRLRTRRSAQTSLPSPFFSKSRAVDKDRTRETTNKPSVSLSEFLNRKVINASSRSVKFKVSEKRKEPGEIAELGDTSDSQSKSSFEGGEVSRKRKNAVDDPSGSSAKRTTPKPLVVIGDEPNLLPYGRQKKTLDNRIKPFYDHYVNGS